jgi:hypothetical protein
MVNRDLWKLGEDLKKGTTLENWSVQTGIGANEFRKNVKEMPAEGRSKGTWGGQYNRP